ncbi:hypothetical protein Tco_1045742 [Tanacetum coccineum]|uniref:Uncharacterized protein n=1 Tax=Tanacetum coccineum TaxID=301880 RepID=A0ABQ5GVK3_9ASTR
MVSLNDLKTGSENDDNDLALSANPTIDHDLDYFNDFENEFLAIVYNDGLTSKSDLWIKTPVSTDKTDECDPIDETSLSEYEEEIISRFNDLFNDTHSIWHHYLLLIRDTYGSVNVYDFRGYLHQSRERQDPMVVEIEDRMIAYTISGRGQAPEKICGGEEEHSEAVRWTFYWAVLAAHYGLGSDEGLRGCSSLSRAPFEMIYTAREDSHKHEVAPEIPAPAPAQAPPPAPQPHTISQRMDRLKEEIRVLHLAGSLVVTQLMDTMEPEPMIPFDTTLAVAQDYQSVDVSAQDGEA